jgi:predicted nuclease of predicted toxin-antitoxin system
MRFKVDENLPVEIADLLRSAGQLVETIEEEGLRGVDGDVLMMQLQREGRALVTLDLDFSDIRAYPPQAYHGIIILRTKRQDKATLLTLVQQFIPLLQVGPLAGNLWIVEADRVRIRGGTAP